MVTIDVSIYEKKKKQKPMLKRLFCYFVIQFHQFRVHSVRSCVYLSGALNVECASHSWWNMDKTTTTHQISGAKVQISKTISVCFSMRLYYCFYSLTIIMYFFIERMCKEREREWEKEAGDLFFWADNCLPVVALLICLPFNRIYLHK